ncbi:MAG: hypothetical protein AAFO78_13730 [Pseudomonadota bacterium]
MNLFGDYEIQGGTLIAKETGAHIPLTTAFMSDVVRIGSFVGFVNALKATRFLRGHEPRAKISFFPRKPRSYYQIWPVCQMADVKIVDDPDEADLHFYFEDREFLTGPRAQPSARPSLNVGCYDIRKSIVALHFEQVFGYGLEIDPLTFTGPAVEKSEGNGKHDGEIVQCPLAAPKPGKVYQRLIDNTFDGSDFVDIRTPVVGDTIPFVYLKRRRRATRFTNDNDRVDLIDPDAVLSAAEQAQIVRFAQSMALDFGGLDVLRNREDGRIYIVDVNKTDMGPPSVLSGRQKMLAIRGLGQAFARMVDDRLLGLHGQDMAA